MDRVNRYLQQYTYAQFYLERCKQIQMLANSDPRYNSTVVPPSKKLTPVIVLDDDGDVLMEKNESQSSDNQQSASSSPNLQISNSIEVAEAADLHITGEGVLREWIDISELDVGKHSFDALKAQNLYNSVRTAQERRSRTSEDQNTFRSESEAEERECSNLDADSVNRKERSRNHLDAQEATKEEQKGTKMGTSQIEILSENEKMETVTEQVNATRDEDEKRTEKGAVSEIEQKPEEQKSAAQFDSFWEYFLKIRETEANWADINVEEEIEIEDDKVERKEETLLKSSKESEEVEERKEEAPPESCKETEEIEERKEETPPEPCKETEELEERKEETPPESPKEAESGDKFKCKHCSYKTNWRGNMTKHVISRHQSSEEIKWYECAHCLYKGKTKEYLRTHLRQAHDQFVTWYNCTKCPFRFKAKQFLQSHILSIHTPPEDVNWFKCEQCDFKCKFRVKLKRHKMNRHTNENEIQWFKCDSCKYKAKSKKGLKKHVINKHTDYDLIKWFKCEKCEYEAKESRRLLVHMRDHHPVDEEPKKEDAFSEKELCCQMCRFQTHSRTEFQRHFRWSGKSFFCQ